MYPAATGTVVDKATVSTVKSNDFADCPCDLTIGACDAHCCCDKECAQNIRDIW